MNATAALLNDLVCLKQHIRRLPGDFAEMIPNDGEDAIINQVGQSCFGACYKTKEQARSGTSTVVQSMAAQAFISGSMIFPFSMIVRPSSITVQPISGMSMWPRVLRFYDGPVENR